MKINRAGILTYYDKRRKWPPETGSTVSAVTGVIGEDLVLSLLCHYLNGKVFSHTCKPVGASGHRLDAWIHDEKNLYQVEVKNWSTHSIGGREIPNSPEGLQAVAERNLDDFLNSSKSPAAIWKVLGRMIVPNRFPGRKPIPVLAFWAPVARRKMKPPSFWFDCKPSIYLGVIPPEIEISSRGRIQIFSASLYLRSLKSEFIDLPMPRAEARLRTLGELLGN